MRIFGYILGIVTILAWEFPFSATAQEDDRWQGAVDVIQETESKRNLGNIGSQGSLPANTSSESVEERGRAPAPPSQLPASENKEKIIDQVKEKIIDQAMKQKDANVEADKHRQRVKKNARSSS